MSILRPLISALRALPIGSVKRLTAVGAAVLLLCGAVVCPASRQLPCEEMGETFGEVHWYRQEGVYP